MLSSKYRYDHDFVDIAIQVQERCSKAQRIIYIWPA